MSRYNYHGDMRSSIKYYQDELKELSRKCVSSPVKIFREEAKEMKIDCQARVPLKTGRLQSSIYVIVDTKPGNCKIRAGAKAINPNDGYNYAPIQHENENYDHSGGGANLSIADQLAGKGGGDDDRDPFYISEPFDFTVEVIRQRLEKELKL